MSFIESLITYERLSVTGQYHKKVEELKDVGMSEKIANIYGLILVAFDILCEFHLIPKRWIN